VAALFADYIHKKVENARVLFDQILSTGAAESSKL